MQQEARRNIRATALDLTERLEACVLLIVAARSLGELEQLLLELIQRARDRVLELIGGSLEKPFEERTHARRQVRSLFQRLHDLLSTASTCRCGPLTHDACAGLPPSCKNAIRIGAHAGRALEIVGLPPLSPPAAASREKQAPGHSGTSIGWRTAAAAARTIAPICAIFVPIWRRDWNRSQRRRRTAERNARAGRIVS